MKRLIPILVFLFASIGSYAQNWNPLKPSTRNYFTNVHGYLRGVRLDSINAYGTDLHYFPFKTIRGNYYGMLYPNDTAGSWLGEDIIGKSDGTFLFPNYWDDTVRIRTRAQVGDSWLFYEDNTSVYYNAEVTGVDTMTVLGSLDSIKTILLTAYNNGVPLLTDSFNNVELILSKDHGFYQTMELYLFPFHLPDTTTMVTDYYFIYSLKPADFTMGWNGGSPGPHPCLFRLVDYVVPIYTDIYNWEIGDIYEYAGCRTYGGAFCDEPNYYQLDTVVDKIVYADSVRYNTSGWINWRWPHDTVFAFFDTTNTVKYLNTEAYLFESSKMPEEFDPAQGMIWTWAFPLRYYYPDDISYCTQSPRYAVFFDLNLGLSGEGAHTVYKTGIGKIINHRWVYDGMILTVDDTALVWYERNGTPCGTYAFGDTTKPVSVIDVNVAVNIDVYPNPASEQLIVETALLHYDVSLMNAVGQMVYKKEKVSGKVRVDVSGFVSGVYYLRIETPKHAVVNKKVLVQH